MWRRKKQNRIARKIMAAITILCTVVLAPWRMEPLLCEKTHTNTATLSISGIVCTFSVIIIRATESETVNTCLTNRKIEKQKMY